MWGLVSYEARKEGEIPKKIGLMRGARKQGNGVGKEGKSGMALGITDARLKGVWPKA